MNSTPPPPLPSVDTPPLASTTVGARLMNVLVTPGEVFDEVKASRPCPGNWLVPVLLRCAVAVAAVWLTLSQDAILHQIQERKEREIEKQLARMPEGQREQARRSIEKLSSPAMVRTFGMLSAVPGAFFWLFVTTLGLWAVGRLVLRARFGFGKTLEVCGLAGVIDLLHGVVGTLLIVGLGNVHASPSLALLIRDYDPAKALHLMASAINVMSLWYLTVLAIGLARLSGVALWKPLSCLGGLWMLGRAGLIWIATRGA